jgi:hypothetical protein
MTTLPIPVQTGPLPLAVLVNPPLDEVDRAALARARALVETMPLAVRIAGAVGGLVDKGLASIAGIRNERVEKVARNALRYALKTAVLSLRGERRSGRRLHNMATALTGAMGGLGGLPATMVELPFTTTLIMRGIAQQARLQGEDLADPATQQACLQVFAFGGPAKADDAAETGYWATRMAFAQAAGNIVQTGLSVAARTFGLVLSQKVAVQAAPVVGAATGGAVNALFTDYYQRLAEGHFIIRRLERKYGVSVVRNTYDTLPRI